MPGAASLVLTIPTSKILWIRLKRLYYNGYLLPTHLPSFLPSYLCIRVSLFMYAVIYAVFVCMYVCTIYLCTQYSWNVWVIYVCRWPECPGRTMNPSKCCSMMWASDITCTTIWARKCVYAKAKQQYILYLVPLLYHVHVHYRVKFYVRQKH
jgi:hypothetical protein